MRHSYNSILIFVFCLYQCSLCQNCVVGEEKVKWTSADDYDENPPLPLSMKQRQQLLQLQKVISTSSDPQGTIQKVAESNGMSPGELVNMLNKNARDLQQDPTLIQPKTIPKAIIRAIASIGVIVSNVAKANPRFFSVSVLAILLILYTIIEIPRTGLHVSTSRKIILSNGPTSIFPPPQRYLHKLIESTPPGKRKIIDRTGLSINVVKKDWDDLILDSDGVNVHILPRKHELNQAITAQFTISPDVILEEFAMGETEEQISEERHDIVNLLFASAKQLLSERRLVEFASTSSSDHDGQSIRSVANLDNNMGVLVVPGLGNFGRYGLIFWKATHQSESEDTATVTLTTLKKMGFFDGQIHITAMAIPQEDGMIHVRVSLVVPKGGRAVSKICGQKIVQEIADSIVQSCTRRTKQILARKSQGRRFKLSGSRRANERRKTRSERERLLELMAEDRRRRWQRSNPDSGRYRPSGRRQLSPNNC
jgi:hypothetical protein